MVLAEVETGRTVKVTRFDGGKGLEGKLRQLGMCRGDVVHIVRRAPFHGPIMLSYEGREIALGFGIANKIEVEGLE